MPRAKSPGAGTGPFPPCVGVVAQVGAAIAKALSGKPSPAPKGGK
jgi:hypothetical protein